MLLLAEQLPAPDSFQGIGWMIVSLTALVVIVERGMALWAHFKPTPPTGELQITTSQLAERIADLEKQRVDDLRIGSDRRAKIYAELKTQRDDFQLEIKSQRADFLKEIKDVYQTIDKDRATVNAALRDLPNEIIATLRNTGVIK